AGPGDFVECGSHDHAALSSIVTLFFMPPRNLEKTLNVLPSSPYRLPIASYVAPLADLSRIAAVASTASPLTLPLRSHGAMVTRGVLRIRLTFQDFSWVMTTRPSPAGAAQMAVGLGLPSLVNVVSRMYSDFAMSAKVAGTTPT